MITTHAIQRTAAALLAAVALAGCAEDAPETAVESWDDFKAEATHIIDGREVYLVEWDLPVTEDELRAYYDRHVAPPDQRPAQLESIVNVVNGEDNVWPGLWRRSLTYCIADEFGPLKSRVVSEMAAATAAWEAVADVNFTYVPQGDAHCPGGPDHPDTVFSVRPTSGELPAIPFFPWGPWPTHLFLNYEYMDSAEWHRAAPDATSVGVLRHELGHALGLRHEYIRTSTTCHEDQPYAELTPYDDASVMQYPQCGGPLHNKLEITPLDADGVNALYGPRPARPAVGMSHRCVKPHEFEVEFTVGWHKIRGPANATRYELDLLHGDHYERIYAGPASSAKFPGKTQRRAIVRVRACNADGCSSYESASDIDNRCGLDDPL